MSPRRPPGIPDPPSGSMSRGGKCGCAVACTPPQIMRGEGDRQHKSPRSRSTKPRSHFELEPRPYLPPPSKEPGAAREGSGRTQAWEGHARATHCRRPPSHAKPDTCLGKTRPPPSAPHQCPPPAKSSAPAFHPQCPSILPESRRPRPVPYLTARSSPLSLHPCAHPSPGHAAWPGDLRRACVCEHSRAPVRARR